MSQAQGMATTDWGQMFRRHILLVGLCILAGGITAAVGSWLAKPVYEGVVVMQVDPNSPRSVLAEEMPVWWENPTTLYTHVELARSRLAMVRVCEKLGVPETDRVEMARNLREKTRASVIRNTNLLAVTVADHDRVKARDLAKAIGEELVAISIERRQEESRRIREFLDGQLDKTQRDLTRSELALSPRAIKVNEEMYRLLLSKRHEANISEHSQIGELMIVDPPVIPEKPVRPRKFLNVILGLMLGAMVGLLAIFVREQWGKGVGSVDELEGLSSTPVLGWVPRFKVSPGKDWISNPGRLLAGGDGDLHLEPYRMITANMDLLQSGQACKSLLVTSSLPGEGKSRTTACLGLALVKDRKKVVVVEGDLRRPSLGNIWSLKGPGLAEVASGRMPLEKALVLPDPAVPNFTVLLAGNGPVRQESIAMEQQLEGILRELEKSFDIILVDSSPILLASDAIKLTRIIDGIVVVIEADATPRSAYLRTLRHLGRGKAKIVGAILNKLPKRSSPYGRYYGSYYAAVHE